MAKPVQTPAARTRLPADERKQTILNAAREQFAKNGDIGATTTKMIADTVGVSEAIVYRHFDTKEELYFEAVVQPLQHIVEGVVTSMESFPQSAGGFDDEEQRDIGAAFMEEALAGMDELLPLLGLVLFGEQSMARDFYQQCWKPSLDRISAVWRGWYEHAGIAQFPDTDIAARLLFGICMVCALDDRYAGVGDRRAVAQSIVQAGLDGAWLKASGMPPT
jgi:AcrR family transcriptional regulator